jgi:hypothetical protein
VGNVVAFAGDEGYWQDVPAQKWTVVHELAHVWDIKSGFRFSQGMIARGMWTYTEPGECQVPARPVKLPDMLVQEWPAGRSTQGLNPREDWAESVAAYVYPEHAGKPEVSKWISRSRWHYVAQEMNPGNPHRYLYPKEWHAITYLEADVAE